MFSGIVETTASILTAQDHADLVRIQVAKPPTFTDLNLGDSICTDGVCLTLERVDKEGMTFALGLETLNVTGWTAQSVLGRVVNLERSLRLNDRIHGHLVTGHVDTRARVVVVERKTDWQLMSLELPQEWRPFVWTKGSIAINGVSLTVNQVDGHTLSVGLIPETLNRTNLGHLQEGSYVNLEIDNMARGLVNWAKLQKEAQ